MALCLCLGEREERGGGGGRKAATKEEGLAAEHGWLMDVMMVVLMLTMVCQSRMCVCVCVHMCLWLGF